MGEKVQQLHSIKHKGNSLWENTCGENGFLKKEGKKGQRKEEMEEGRKDQIEST